MAIIVRSARAAFVFAIVAMLHMPMAAATPGDWCRLSLGGVWDVQGDLCTVSVASNRNAVMRLSVNLPVELIDSPYAGPVLRTYTRSLVDRWRTIGLANVRDSVVTSENRTYFHSNTVKSIVFHEFWQTEGSPANNAYRTFTFDLDQGRQLGLADLFNEDIDPRTAIAPLAMPYITDALNQALPPHDPGSYPFAAREWTPSPDGSGYSGEYRAFALTADELILYMPDSPMAQENPTPRDRLVWSMDGGTVIVAIPLHVLRPILRPAYWGLGG